jgi:hypothetical protein
MPPLTRFDRVTHAPLDVIQHARGRFISGCPLVYAKYVEWGIRIRTYFCSISTNQVNCHPSGLTLIGDFNQLQTAQDKAEITEVILLEMGRR